MSKGKKFNALLIGLGQMGMGYDLDDKSGTKVLTHANALNIHEKFNFIAAIDNNPTHKEQFSSRYSVPIFSSLSDINIEEPIDLVIISTPTSTHLPFINDVLNTLSPQLVVCEKPFTCSSMEAQLAISACKKANCKLLINYIRRTEPGALKCKQILQSNLLGKIEKGVVWYSKGLVHNGSHFLNLLESWLGKATLKTIVNSSHYNESDLSTDALISFGNIPIYFLSRKEENFSYYAIELDCEKGRLIYDDGGFRISLRQAISDPHFPNYIKLSDNPEVIDNDLLRYQTHALNDWYNCLCEKKFKSCTALEALNTHLLLNKIRHASNNPELNS